MQTLNCKAANLNALLIIINLYVLVLIKHFLNLSVGLPLGLKTASLSLNSADELINLFKIILKTWILLS
jgi:hypothetical protein